MATAVELLSSIQEAAGVLACDLPVKKDGPVDAEFVSASLRDLDVAIWELVEMMSEQEV